ncbi:MAG: hypothetical protein GY820_38265 [Gammaproteobacteria bacterium]|nr:hypothetical protein [Gammaproteobacteria bacterium]
MILDILTIIFAAVVVVSLILAMRSMFFWILLFGALMIASLVGVVMYVVSAQYLMAFGLAAVTYMLNSIMWTIVLIKFSEG